MNHGVKGRKLTRTASHRKALMNNLAVSLLRHKRIRTTTAKAKELRGFIEPIIAKAVKGDLHSRRQIMAILDDREVLKELFTEIVAAVGDRKGGYTRVVKLGRRLGDAAEVAIIELVDFNSVMNEKAVARKEEKEATKKEKAEKAK